MTDALSELVGYVLWAATPRQRGRVLSALAPKAELVGLFVRTRPAFAADRAFWWGLWRSLVLKDAAADRAVRLAMGPQEWKPEDEPRLWRDYW